MDHSSPPIQFSHELFISEDDEFSAQQLRKLFYAAIAHEESSVYWNGNHYPLGVVSEAINNFMERFVEKKKLELESRTNTTETAHNLSRAKIISAINNYRENIWPTKIKVNRVKESVLASKATSPNQSNIHTILKSQRELATQFTQLYNLEYSFTENLINEIVTSNQNQGYLNPQVIHLLEQSIHSEVHNVVFGATSITNRQMLLQSIRNSFRYSNHELLRYFTKEVSPSPTQIQSATSSPQKPIISNENLEKALDNALRGNKEAIRGISRLSQKDPNDIYSSQALKNYVGALTPANPLENSIADELSNALETDHPDRNQVEALIDKYASAHLSPKVKELLGQLNNSTSGNYSRNLVREIKDTIGDFRNTENAQTLLTYIEEAVSDAHPNPHPATLRLLHQALTPPDIQVALHHIAQKPADPKNKERIELLKLPSKEDPVIAALRYSLENTALNRQDATIVAEEINRALMLGAITEGPQSLMNPNNLIPLIERSLSGIPKEIIAQISQNPNILASAQVRVMEMELSPASILFDDAGIETIFSSNPELKTQITTYLSLTGRDTASLTPQEMLDITTRELLFNITPESLSTQLSQVDIAAILSNANLTPQEIYSSILSSNLHPLLRDKIASLQALEAPSQDLPEKTIFDMLKKTPQRFKFTAKNSLGGTQHPAKSNFFTKIKVALTKLPHLRQLFSYIKSLLSSLQLNLQPTLPFLRTIFVSTINAISGFFRNGIRGLTSLTRSLGGTFLNGFLGLAKKGLMNKLIGGALLSWGWWIALIIIGIFLLALLFLILPANSLGTESLRLQVATPIGGGGCGRRTCGNQPLR